MHCGFMNNKNKMLRQAPLLLLLLCAASAVQHSAAAAASVNPRAHAAKELAARALHSFTWMSNDADATLRVCFGFNETGDEISAPSKPFELTYTVNDTSELAVWSNEDPDMVAPGIYCFNVALDPTTISYTTKQTYGVNSADVYAFAKFRMNMEPGILSAESLIASNTIRVGGVTGYDLPDCTPHGGSFCFLPSSDAPTELCVESDDILTPPNSVLVCDLTYDIIEVIAETQGTKAMLYYNDSASTIQVTAPGNADSLQILLRDPTEGSYAACDEKTCPAERPGTSVYSILIVELNGEKATSSSNVIIQDLNLTVVSSDPVIDFHFANIREEQTYEVYSKPTAMAELEGAPITLDCTRVPQDKPCFAFVRSDGQPTYIAVRYGNQTNEVVTQVTYTAH